VILEENFLLRAVSNLDYCVRWLGREIALLAGSEDQPLNSRSGQQYVKIEARVNVICWVWANGSCAWSAEIEW